LAKSKVVYLPLDERPCNFDFPYFLSQSTGVDMVRPDLKLMGFKKKAGDTEGLWAWLEQECADADGAIISLDTLLYGGIVPSRLHSLSADDCRERLSKLRALKERNPKLKLFAMHLIMRCPKYSNADEEPDYYDDYGREIFLKGYIGHRQELGLATESELDELKAIEAKLPAEVIGDYLGRRAVNVEANKASLQFVEEGVIDFLIIPQDDSAPYGWTAKDQQAVRAEIANRNAELSTLMYPGADEVGCTLFVRMINEMNGAMPLVYPRLAGVNSPSIIPSYEDRPLFESLKYQILAAGGQVASSAEEADMILLVNAPGGDMTESNNQHIPSFSYQVLRNTVELVEYGSFAMKRYGKPVAVGDVAYANGGDLQLLKLLRNKGILFDVAGYAGWNTSSNTLGTVIAQMMIYAIYGKTQSHLDFLALRYAEDFGYCATVRRQVAEGPVKEMGLSYFGVDGQRGEISSIVKERLQKFVQDHVDTPNVKVEIEDVYMPWSRMFEAGITAKAVVHS